MTYDWETMQAFEKLKTERACTPAPKLRKKRGTHCTWTKVKTT